METVGIIGGILAILVSLGTLGGFVIYLFKEAIAKGRLYQRIDSMEKNVDKIDAKQIAIDDKVSCHDGDIIKVTGEIESLRDLMERMDKKLDRLVESK